MPTNEELPFATTAATSKLAADSMAKPAAALRGEVFRAIFNAGENGMTDEEIQKRLLLGGNTQRPRRRELVESGAIRESGRTRQTVSGRKAVVWIVNRPVTPAVP